MRVEPRRRLGAAAVAAVAKVAFAVIAALGLAAGTGSARAQPRPETLTACAACHGADGNAPVAAFPSLAGQPAVFIENQLVLIREGLRDVPAMKQVMAGMGDPEIVALARHYAAQKVRQPALAFQADKQRQGAQLADRLLCGSCHLPSFAGQNQVPRLAAQNEAFLLLSMKEFRDRPGPGRDTIMAATLRGLSDAELDQLAHYLAGFKAP